MKVKLCDGFIVAEGSEIECALYTHILLESIRLKAEKDQQEEDKKQADDIGKWISLTFEQILKRERDEEE